MTNDDLLWSFYLEGCRVDEAIPISREAFDLELVEMRRMGIDRERFDELWASAKEKIGRD